MKFPCAVSLLLVGVISGCSTSPKDCDPSEGDFFSSAVGVISGCYERRQNQLTEEIAAEQSLNESLHQMLASIDEEKRQVGKQLRNEEARMSALNRSWVSLKASLKTKAEANQSLQFRIDQLQSKMDQLNSTPTLERAEKERQLNSLRRHVDLLMVELDAGVY
jgi:chromosome condensin MukBEF ATPase and DNA-binding subunit MukB